ncbi:chemotaxis protein CheA [Maridesulfovibrio salexigens]|uniref:Chemotaxis protein CheA n=1 Tax=Maridesulfovibrio salexigens (strain ATCC 14822 / DSM 2638 / NCIMB 8403 / VKM B-1763) TaxID=526222 RepID=C6BZY1_MARSD|nr:chemotaxis protein CheW [Maridesulfovibrio salexigens]ACS80852.1 putative CheA signal transduction histidine kinase [Maridesulfovibrio salexigens DSM 2638]
MKDSISSCISQLQESIISLEHGSGDINDVLKALGLDNAQMRSAQIIALMDMLSDGITPITPDLITSLLDIAEAQKKFFYCIGGLLDQGGAPVESRKEAEPVCDPESREKLASAPDKYEQEMMAEMLAMTGETPPEDEGWEKVEAQQEDSPVETDETQEQATELSEKIETEPAAAAKQISDEEESTKVQPAPAKKKDAQAISSIRVSTQQLDSLIELVGKLMVTYAVIAQTKTDNISKIASSLSELDKVIRNLQSEVDEIRLVPLKQIFMPMHRLVKSTSQKLDKRIKFTINGEELALDKTIVECLNEPLVHLLRNALDHGIESTEDRQMCGKDEVGNVSLSAFRKGEFAYIEIADDGKGLDADILLSKALERGLADPEKEYAKEEIYEFILQSGFSTASAVTDISGRGVGMDAVVTAIQNTLDGKVSISSELGKGSTFTIAIPLSRSVNEGIVDALVTTVGPETFIFPSREVLEVYEPVEKEFTDLPDGRETVSVRGKVHPLIRMYKVFDLPAPSEEVIPKVILVKMGDTVAAIMVDEVLRQQKAVVTGFTLPVNSIYKLPILGFGMMGEHDALVVDTETLIASYMEADS